MIELRAENKTKKYEYRTWRRPEREGRIAKDDIGNTYTSRPITSSGDSIGWTDFKVLNDGDTIVDTLAFEPLVEAANHIDLDLPGENMGVGGTFRFRIPREAWVRK